MKKTNIGLINYVVFNNIKNNYFGNKIVSESKIGLSNLLNTISNSKILQLEFKIYNNLENKEISDDIMASRYIDNNIRLLEVYDKNEVLEEHKLLNGFKDISIDEIPQDKITLYENIDSLIMESLKNPNDVNVDILHESFSHVLSHIKKPKTNKEINGSIEYPEHVVELAINKFNDKYNTLSEDEKLLFKMLTTSTANEKKEILENYKIEILDILNKHENSNMKESIDKAISKINKMEFDEVNIDSDIISLFEFKKELN